MRPRSLMGARTNRMVETSTLDRAATSTCICALFRCQSRLPLRPIDPRANHIHMGRKNRMKPAVSD